MNKKCSIEVHRSIYDIYFSLLKFLFKMFYWSQYVLNCFAVALKAIYYFVVNWSPFLKCSHVFQSKYHYMLVLPITTLHMFTSFLFILKQPPVTKQGGASSFVICFLSFLHSLLPYVSHLAQWRWCCVALYMWATYCRKVFCTRGHDPFIQSSINGYKRMVRF
jgi:hypothetical protein